MSGDATRFLNHALSGQRHGTAPHHHASATEGTDALLNRHSVAVTNRYMIHGNMHLVRYHLGIGSLVSLAMAAGTGEHGDLAGALHPHGAAFKAGAAAGLHEGRNPNSHQFTARPGRVALAD